MFHAGPHGPGDHVFDTQAAGRDDAHLRIDAQLTENEVLPNPNGFGKLHRGLTVYGFEVIQPKALGHARVTATAYTA